MNGAGADVATESLSISGTQGRSQEFGVGNEDELQQRIQEFRQREQQINGLGGLGGGQAGQGGPGGPGGGGQGGFGGPGGAGMPMMIGRMGRGGFNLNQPHGFLYAQDDTAGLDARPYSLSGIESPKASYNTLRFGSMVGGPLKIPKLFDWSKTTFFTVGWNGSRGSTPFDEFSTVPTLAERSGIFSGLTSHNGTPITIYNPQTSLPFAANSIDPATFSSAAVALLNYIPTPNLPGTTQNFHYITSDQSSTDAVSLRLIHNFSGTGPGFGPPGGPGGGGGGGRNRRGPRNNLNFGFNWTRTSIALVNSYPSLAGHTNTQGLNANTGWTYGKGRRTNTLRFTYNHNHVATTNLYSTVTDVAGARGHRRRLHRSVRLGSSRNQLHFVRRPHRSHAAPRTRSDLYRLRHRIWYRGKHNWRFGGDYRRILQSFRSAKNAEGSFVFTGFETSAYRSRQHSAASRHRLRFRRFSARSAAANLAAVRYQLLRIPRQLLRSLRARRLAHPSQACLLNLGFRYEYNGPYTEAEQSHRQSRRRSPQSTAASPVLSGQNGAYPRVARSS